MPESSLTLSPAAFLHIESSDGQHKARIDVYEARRALEEACRQPNDGLRNDAILNWLSGKLQVAREQLAENMALEFNDCIAAVVERLNEERKKKAERTASSPASTPDCQPPSQTGP